MNLGLLLGWLPVIGVAVGLLRTWLPRLPVVAAAALIAAYVLYVASYGVWAAQCWNCKVGVSETRSDMLLIAGMFFGLLLILTLAGITLGARLTIMVGRLFRTVGELRRGGEQQGRPPVT